VQNYALAGTTAINAELNRSSKHDVVIFYTLLSLMLVLFGYLSLRSWKSIMIMLMVVVGSIVPTMGLIALLNIPYNMITVMMPTVLIALSVADAIHVINYFHIKRQSNEAPKAAEETIDHMWRPGLWTTLTTIVGFTSLLISTVYPIFQLGLFTSIGILLALLLTLIMVPGMLVAMYPEISPKAHNTQFGYSLSQSLPAFIMKHRYLSFAILILLIFSFTGIINLRVDTNYTKFFSKRTKLTRAYDDIQSSGYAQNPVTLVFRYPDGSDFTSRPYFSQLLQFEKEAIKLPEVIKLLSANDLIYQIDKAFLKEETSYADFSQYGQDQVAQLLLLGEMSSNDDIYDLLKYDRTKVQIQVLTNYMSSKELDAFKARLTRLKNKHISDDLEMTFTGSTVLWANMDKQISRTQLFSLFGVLAFLIIFFPLIFRSFKLGLLGVLVNILPIFITYGFMGLFGVEINLATAIIGGVSLGIVSDDTIHLLYRYKHFRKDGMAPHEAIIRAMQTSGRSIITTSIILVGTFSIMTTSNFLPTYNFGLMISICITVALFVDMMVLPNVINVFFKAGRPVWFQRFLKTDAIAK
jgi:predicted RND superfamily exporter protein